MPGQGLDYSALFNRGLPPPAAPWDGHPKFNFIGGHSDPDMVPTDGFIESAGRVFRGDPRNISMYNFDGGPQGIIPLRQFVVDKLARHRGVEVATDEVLVTSGSGQGIELINEVLLEEGDTAIVESFSFSSALNNLRRRKVNVVGIDVDQDGMNTDHLARALEDLRNRGVRPKYIYTIPTLQNPTGTVMSMARRAPNAGSERGIRRPDFRRRMLRRPDIRRRIRKRHQIPG